MRTQRIGRAGLRNLARVYDTDQVFEGCLKRLFVDDPIDDIVLFLVDV
jgi:hypothetical protein